MMGKPCIIPGTRPEIIKMSPVVRACERQEGSEWFVVHTGQGCSCDVDRVFFEQPELPDAKYNLDVGSGSGRYEEGIVEILIDETTRLMNGMDPNL